ncbi:hypothetical protein BUALT_Bualt19G0000700 [Buddleja alternifolia]|uniref:Uncharacterized protein n=1 Tax=Buddleja alternifolia TaxID=168488 RepID=A0AAV6W4K1_9LAMI|nr:hypothetical protein BUALT_Bualt19G0000700 [Buddleja alternifolia]
MPAPPPRRSPISAPAPPRMPPISAPAPQAATPPRSPILSPPPRMSPISAAPPRSPIPSPSRSPIASPAPAPSSPVSPQPSPPRTPRQTHSPNPTPPSTNTSPPTTSSIPETTHSVPASPKTRALAPSSSIPTPPIPKPLETVNAKPTTPLSSPKIVQPSQRSPPPQSPKIKPLSRAPSPLTLPPPQINSNRETMIEQKDVLVQETIDKTIKVSKAHNTGNSSNGKREPTPKDKGTSKKVSSSEELGMRMITMAGENKGAVMELSLPHKTNHSLGKPHTLKKNSNGNGSSSEGGEDGKTNNMDKTDRGMTTPQSPMTSFLNSNVQGLNNSILYNCNFQNNNPGIHLSLNRKANGGRSKD